MSYMALYRKWRPDEFQEVKGQEHIVTTLKNQIKHERVGHAYLFCGTRGTGKTTIAKLMAKAVNCEHPVDGSPCNECETCKAIAAGTSMNVIEIDAASNNGVDNIRQINNAVQYSPQSGKYLVYIIDEVHMLSIGAFNALLKTLEEPPAYVIFILATTESHKIPITILSRCQRYDFRRIDIETITDRLEELLQRENISATRDALAYVAKAADGSMRDALSILDQCIAFNLGEELTYDKVLETIGAVDIEVYIELFSAIKNKAPGTAVDIIDKAVWQGKDLTQLTNEFTGFVRNVLMLKMDSDMKVDVSSENIPRLIELGRDMSEDYLISFINILSETAGKLGYATNKRILLEVTVIKLCKPEMQTGTAALEERIRELEDKLDKGIPAGQVVYVNSNEVPQSLKDVSERNDEAENTSAEGQQIVNNLRTAYGEATAKEMMSIYSTWKKCVIPKLMKPMRDYVQKAAVNIGENKDSIMLVFASDDRNNINAIDYFDKDINREILQDAVSEIFERSIRIDIRKQTKLQAREARVPEFDMSKVNFEIDYSK
ncbi:MAG: DNA polymerase III subunit gamma/tau [Wujia sp.]